MTNWRTVFIIIVFCGLVLLKPPSVFAQVTLSLAGDVMLARAVTAQMRAEEDFRFPLKNAESFFNFSDLVWVNLESPFGLNCPTNRAGMVFCADPRGIEGLIGGQVGLVSLANNHALNQGEEGLAYTTSLLKENFIEVVGLREPVYWEKEGIRFGFLAYNGVNPRENLIGWADPEVVAQEVEKLSKEVDLVIVYFHWGQEYTSLPQAGGPAPVHPRQLAHTAIEAGAEVVVGAHPHVVQPVEWHQGKLIIYSLGNFVFDQGWSEPTKRGLVARLKFDREGLVMATFLPVIIEEYQPRLVSALDNPWFDF